MGFFEENPVVFVTAFVVVVHGWLRVREPLFRWIGELRRGAPPA